MVLDSLFDALFSLLTVSHLSYLILGVLLGVAIGILPGLGGIVGFSIMLPFLYGMDVTSALALLIGLVAVIPTSDTFTSVLMGIPGSSASQATVLDGYPLSKQGHAARALGAAFFSSLIGGLLGAVFLTVLVLFARTFILSLGSAELFMLAVLGLSTVGVLSGDNIFKGFLACGVGLLLGSIGAAPATGEWRMAFGSYYLFDGIKIVIVGLGVFAVPEITDLLVKNRRISERSTLGSGWLQGVKDVWRHKLIVLRCSPLGALIGAIPGLGGSVVDWIAYGHVVQTAKDKSKFGKGDIRGVIAPESANNAKEGGGLVPTLLFGIPGSGSMAVFLGGLTLLGIEAGPNMVGSNLNVTYTIIWSLALANVIGTVVCLLLSGQVSKITTIPYGYLAPYMIMIICFAAFQVTRSLEDLVLLLVIGCIGIVFKYFNWSRPALLVGFVLADTIETYLYQAVQFYSWSFIERPIVIGLIVAIVISIGMGNFLNKKSKSSVHMEDLPGKGSAKQKPETKTDDTTLEKSNHIYSFFTGELLLVLGILAFALYAIFDSSFHSFLGKVFPISTAVLIVIFTLPLCFALTSKQKQEKTLFRALTENGKISPYFISIWKNFLWFVGLAAGTWLIGFIVSLAFLFLAVIRTKTKASWLKTGIISAVAIGLLLGISKIMILELPTGVIPLWLGWG